jgi:serine/threonine protein kinase
MPLFSFCDRSILFSTPDADSDLKLTDFGFAKNLLAPSRNLRAKTQTGTAGYMSPEILAGKEYDEKCDTWSLGIVVYIMLSGLPPFVTPEDMEGRCEQPFWLYMNNMRASDGPRPVEFRDDMGWKYVSAQAKHFLASALELDPSKRMRSVDALQHPWLKRRPSHHPTPSMTGSDHSKQNIHQQHHQLNHFLTLTLNRKFDLNKLKEEYGSDEALSPEQAVAEPNFHAEETTAAPPTLDSVLNFSYSPSQPDASTTEAPRSFTSSTTSSTYHSRDSSLASNASSSCSYLARKARQLHYATLPTQYTAEEDDEEEEELQPEFHSSEDEAPVTVTKE